MYSNDNEEETVEGQPEEGVPSMNPASGGEEEAAAPSDSAPPGGSQTELEAKGEQKMVPLAALHEERSRRQTLQKEKEYLNSKLELLENIFQSQLNAKPYPSDENEYGKDSDPLNLGQAKKLFQDIFHLNVYPEVIALREEVARLKYSDYDQVIDGFAEQLRANPALQQAVLAADDPAEMAYKIAKHGHSIWGGNDMQSEKQTARRIEKNLNAPRMPSVRGGEISPEGVTIEKLLEMTPEEFSRVWDSLSPAQKQKLSQGER